MSNTYKVVYRRDAHTISDRTVLGCAKTLQEAAALRKVSGDLVTLHGLVVDSEEWLFPWEKKDPNCYAKQAIVHDAAVRNKTKSYRNQGGYKKPYRRDEREWRLNYEEGCKTLSHMWVYPRL